MPAVIGAYIEFKAPGFGDRKKEMLQDIAAVTGAEFISEDVGRKLEGVDVQEKLEHIFRIMTDRVLWTRGKLAAHEVTGGIPGRE